MYLPYLRGKQFELEALLELPSSVFQNTLPIIEPVNLPRRPFYQALASGGTPFILITNPFHPEGDRVPSTDVQTLIDTHLSAHSTLVAGFIIDTRFNSADLNSFLTTNASRDKAVIFRYSPLPADIQIIQAQIAANNVDYVIFDDRRVNNSTRIAFNNHPTKILLTDGFQRQDKNSNYPAVSSFESNFSTWRTDGWAGIGDYLTIGDHFQAGGGQVYVVTLHVTIQTATGLQVHHFSSTTNSNIKGLSAQKFAEANALLVSSANVTPITSGGIDIFRDLHARSHNPQLGVGKKASIIRHIELMSSIV